MNPTMPGPVRARKTATPQVIEIEAAARRKPRVLKQTAIEICWRWLVRHQAQLYLAKKYGLSRPEIEMVIHDVLSGEHGPFVAPSARITELKRVA